jgi:hypothetical protein
VLSKFSCNLLNGLDMYNGSSLYGNSVKLLNNRIGVFNTASSSTVLVGNSITMGNFIGGMYFANDGFAEVRNNLVISNNIMGIHVDNSTQLNLHGVAVRGHNNNIYAHNANMNINCCDSRMSLHAIVTPIRAVNNSFVILQNSSVVKSGTQRVDIEAWNSSSIICGANVTGSGTGGAVLSDPPLNGAVGNRFSSVYNA